MKILNHCWQWRRTTYPEDGVSITHEEQLEPLFVDKIHSTKQHVDELLELFSQELPKFSPRYMGHMFSEISMPALLGHLVALLHNPNNVSRESSWVGVDLELEAVKELCKMIGYPESSIGHFTSGGTIANFEAFIRAKNKWLQILYSNKDNDLSFNDACYIQGSSSLNFSPSEIEVYKHIKQKYKKEYDGAKLIVPSSKHYSWSKAASIFGIGESNLISVELNKFGQLCVKDLQKQIDRCLENQTPILAIVSVLGTTELGSIDPIDEIQSVINGYKKNYNYTFWHHIDAAYGGFFASLKDAGFFNISKTRALQAIQHSTSITIDPHKLGYVPYASGTFLCKEKEDYFNHEISAPYVDFQQKKDLGPYTLEGSRPATGAASMFMTAKCIGLNENGYGQILKRTVHVKNEFENQCREKHTPLAFVKTIDTNITGFAVIKNCKKLSEVNHMTSLLQSHCLSYEKHKKPYYFSKTKLGKNYKNLIENFCLQNKLDQDEEHLNLMRMTFMNPFSISKNSKTNHINGVVDYLASIIQTL
ncbi:MAG: pyridoxal-dependent decarboxylase [Bdellovibrionales bacterium]|nr:pyridoxal-dependent decarboxylase [Bdellovibrionales bacterium]